VPYCTTAEKEAWQKHRCCARKWDYYEEELFPLDNLIVNMYYCPVLMRRKKTLLCLIQGGVVCARACLCRGCMLPSVNECLIFLELVSDEI
jgi:hypothetical protein